MSTKPGADHFVGLVDPVFFIQKDSTCPNKKEVDITTRHQNSNDANYPKGNNIISWYQTADCPRGFHPVVGASKEDGNGTYDVDNRPVPGVKHTTIDDHKPIHDIVVGIVTGGVKPAEVASPIHEEAAETTPSM